MPTIFVQTLEEFRAEHGEPIQIQDRYIFPDGAEARIDGTMFWGPSEDDFQRLQVILQYRKEIFKNADSHFRRVRASLLELCARAAVDDSVQAPVDGEEILRELRQDVFKKRAAWNEIAAELDETAPMKARLRHEREATERRLKAERVRASIESVDFNSEEDEQ